MKIIINSCFGGFSISNKAIARLAELNGKKAYFFDGGMSKDYIEVSGEEESMWNTAFSTNNIAILNELNDKKDEKSRKIISDFWDEYYLTSRPEDRTNIQLIKVIEELGDKANGVCANLKIIEIPDGVEYEISEYDGFEHIAETHRTWG